VAFIYNIYNSCNITKKSENSWDVIGLLEDVEEKNDINEDEIQIE